MIGYLLLSVLVYVRTYVSGEFKISDGRLGPTEIRAVAVLLNTALYFLGAREIAFRQWSFSIYDIAVAAIALLLLECVCKIANSFSHAPSAVPGAGKPRELPPRTAAGAEVNRAQWNLHTDPNLLY
ncbi:MAG: hypothetical protein WCC12_18185 [Anaerolineales bacterium]